MNNLRRKHIKQIIAMFEGISDEIDNARDCLNTVLEGEQEAYDNMPDNLKYSSRGEDFENVIGEMESITGDAEALTDAIGDLISSLESFIV